MNGNETPRNDPSQREPVVLPPDQNMDLNDGLGRGEAGQDNRIDDVEKAHTMAIAEDEFRTKAVENHSLLRDPPEVAHKYDEFIRLNKQLGDPDNHLKRKERKQLEADAKLAGTELAEAQNTEYGNGKRKEANRKMEGQFSEDFPEEANAVYYLMGGDPEARARFYNAQASRIGDWAGRLHDKPLGDDFLEAHPGVEITPKSLVYMEDEVARLGRDIIGIEALQQKHSMGYEARHTLDPSGRERMIRPSTERVLEIKDLLKSPGAEEEQAKEWEKVSSEYVAAAGRIDEFYDSLVENVKLKPLRNRLALTRNLLSDVRHEVGLETEAGSADVVSQEQPTDQKSE